VGLATATRKASVSLAERDGDEVINVSARLKDVVSSAAQLHGWNQPAAVNVNVANIPLPTDEERAEMREIDRKLDAIAAKLRRSSTGA
jgi:TPP-dependent trihydroxycyclohexane-1,2-dione (THcHDO) dehydratase